MREFIGSCGTRAEAFKEAYDACMKDAVKAAIDYLDISNLEADDESMANFKLVMKGLELINDALDLEITQAKKLDHIEELLEKLVSNTERLEHKLAYVELSQKTIDNRLDSLDEAIRSINKEDSSVG